MTQSSILSFGVSRSHINVRQDFPRALYFELAYFLRRDFSPKMAKICGRAKDTTNINITTRSNQTRYVIFQKWRSIRLCQSFQILTYARPFWVFRSQFLTIRTWFWASGSQFFDYESQFWASGCRFCALGVDFGPLRVNYCGHLGVDILTSGSRFLASECLFRVSGSFLIVAF